MIARIRSRLSYANVASSLALFLALSTGTVYAANEWTGVNIVDDSLFAADLAPNSVGASELADNAAGPAAVVNDSLTANDLANDSVTALEVADNAIDSAAVLNDSLTASDLAIGSVGASEIANGSIGTADIALDSLLSSDLASGSVGSSEIINGAVGSSDIATDAITGAKVAANSLTSADIAGADRSGTIDVGSVSQGRCAQIDGGVSGAKAGEVAVISLKGAVQSGILIYASRVPSDGHVTIMVCNFSGTTMTAIVDLPVRVITFG